MEQESNRKEQDMTAEKRANYEKMSKDYMESAYRREREYGHYLNRYLNDKDKIVDGMDYETRQGRNPMPYNIYFG